MSDADHAAGEGAGASGTEDVQRLRAEVADLRRRLAERPVPRARPGPLRVRRTIAAALVALAGFGLVASVIGVWGARTTLDTDRWVATVAPLPQRPEINAAMAAYLTDQVFDRLDVRKRLAEALPPKAAFLADPVTGAVRDYMREQVQAFMATDRFAALWRQANEFAHAQIVATVKGESSTLTVHDDTVTLNLLPVINDVLVKVSNEMPTLFGRQLRLPALSSAEVPADLRERVQAALGVTLPADFGQITVYHDADLSGFQDAVLLCKRGLFLLVLGTLLCLGLAVWVSPGRRRTLLQFGVAVAIGEVVLAGVLREIRDRMLERVPQGVYREGASAAVHEVFRMLRERGDQMLWLGVAVAAVSYLVGPGRLPVLVRLSIVRGARSLVGRVRSTAADESLRTWTARHLDALRIGGAVVASLFAFLFPSWTALLVVLVIVAAYEAGVAVLARPATPDPRGDRTPARTESPTAGR
ncbi:hypothetical protein [Actinomadura macrotermitis]|uniref:Integral membrane protein n=1 Tax=Actinomadura macrotermitis TaxID=2585200 RepID=A0A7K0BM06_9ACTN|nr:hypothetical protein [Actinomadura macrotermitis]MQY02106.1 hypothetical protein [Actinomadura macrotermitis]